MSPCLGFAREAVFDQKGTKATKAGPGSHPFVGFVGFCWLVMVAFFMSPSFCWLMVVAFFMSRSLRWLVVMA